VRNHAERIRRIRALCSRLDDAVGESQRIRAALAIQAETAALLNALQGPGSGPGAGESPRGHRRTKLSRSRG